MDDFTPRFSVTCGNCGSPFQTDARTRDDAARQACPICCETAHSEIRATELDGRATLALDAEARGRAIAQVAREVATIDPEAFDLDDGWAGIDPSERFPIGDNPFDASDRARAASAVRASCERDDWRTS